MVYKTSPFFVFERDRTNNCNKFESVILFPKI